MGESSGIVSLKMPPKVNRLGQPPWVRKHTRRALFVVPLFVIRRETNHSRPLFPLLERYFYQGPLGRLSRRLAR